MTDVRFTIASIQEVSRRVYARKEIFLVLFALIFLVTFYGFARIGFVPNPVVAAKIPTITLTASPFIATQQLPTASSSLAELPLQIQIPEIGLTASISNPTTTNIDVLDNDLLSGAVRYPTSAELGENGNVVLFGHSSYLPVVRNLAYKTFDGIQKLKPGQNITLYSSHTAYVYSVKSVTKESANDGVIPLSVPGQELTLSTCDSFTQKTDRFVVVSDFVESYPLTSS